MLKETILLMVKNGPAPSAAASVISTILNMKVVMLEGGEKGKPDRSYIHSPIVITENQIDVLAKLRLRGLTGPVLILSHEDFESLMQKNRILRWSHVSHAACEFPWELTDLLLKLGALEALEPENLKQLQKELRAAPDRVLKQKVAPRLKRLERQTTDKQDELEELIEVMESLRESTRVACHSVLTIRGRQAQIQQHLQRLIEEIRDAADYQPQLKDLWEVFSRWRDLVVETGEGLRVS